MEPIIFQIIDWAQYNKDEIVFIVGLSKLGWFSIKISSTIKKSSFNLSNLLNKILDKLLIDL